MAEGKKRSLLKKADIAVAAVFLAVAAVLFIVRFFADGKTAVITVDGKVYEQIDLDRAGDEIINIDTEPAVTLKVENGTICFINSQCRDRLCEKSGVLKNNGDTAACLPARVVVTVKDSASGGSSPDGISY